MNRKKLGLKAINIEPKLWRILTKMKYDGHFKSMNDLVWDLIRQSSEDEE